MIPRHLAVLPQLHSRQRVLVPVLLGQMAQPIISIGDALAGSSGGSGTVLALVEIRSGRDNEVFAQEQRRREMLRWVAGLEYTSDVRRRLGVSLRMTANIASSIRDAMVENQTTSLILERPTIVTPRRHGLSDLARQLLPNGSTDILMVGSNARMQGRALAPRSILAAIRGGPSARVVAFTAAALADSFGSVLTLLHIRTASAHPDRARREWHTFEEIVDELSRPATIISVKHRESAALAIHEGAAGQDLLMIGSRLDPLRPHALVGRELDRMLRHLDSPVVIVRAKHASWPEAARRAIVNGQRP